MQSTLIKILCSLVLLSLSYNLYAQPDLNDNGATHRIFGTAVGGDVRFGAPQDFKIPATSPYDRIHFRLRGADGGFAELSGTTSWGGDGAIAEGVVKLGTATDELNYGRILRFIIGNEGENSTAGAGEQVAGGGAGGTGIILKNGPFFQLLLAAAGGGSGAYRSTSNVDNGQGGRSGESGGDGTGFNAANGGINGLAGEASGVGGEGGGFLSGANGKGGRPGLPDGGIGGESENLASGGYGLGGGGGADTEITTSFLSSGAGGGYSGGGGGGYSSRGGAGGSYLHPDYISDGTKTAGGVTQFTERGYVDYYFFCDANFTGYTVVDDGFCTNTPYSIQLATESYTGCLGVLYKRVDTGETNTTGLFEGLSSGTDYTFEAYFNGDLVDEIIVNEVFGVDGESPVVNCLISSLSFNLINGTPEVQVEGLATATDNCEVATLEIQGYGTSRAFDCDDLGANTLTIVATDLVGNSSTCDVVVTIIDFNEISVFPITAYLDVNGAVSLSQSDFVLDISPLCRTSAELLANYDTNLSFDCDDVGVQNITLTKTINSAIYPDLSVQVTIIDNIPITASTANVTLTLDATGTVDFEASDLIFTVSDNCYTNAQIIAGYSIPMEYSMFDCADIGTVFVPLEVSNTDFPPVTVQVAIESSNLSLPALTPDFCADSSFDLTRLEDDITTASGTFDYSVLAERLYVPDGSNDVVSVINLNDNSVLTSISVGDFPWGVAVSPDGLKVYVTNISDNTVSVIDAISNTVEATINVGNNPNRLTLSPDGSRVYTANRGDGTVTVINALTNSVIGSAISVGTDPIEVSVSPDNAKVLVANQGDGTVSVINASTNTVSATISVANNPRAIGFNSASTLAYVACANFNANNFNVINLGTNVVSTSASIAGQVEDLVVSPNGKVYSSHGPSGSGLVSLVEPANGYSVTNITIQAGVFNNLRGITTNEDGSLLYLTDTSEGQVIAVNTSSYAEAYLPVNANPISIGDFYQKASLSITDPTSYTPSEGEVITVNFDGGTAACESSTTITFGSAIACVELAIKVFLQGPYSTADGAMADDLSSNNLVPTTVSGYTMLSSATSNTGTAAIVDWVSVELRDATDNTSILATRPALLQADGDIVDMDGSSAVVFEGISASAAYVVVRHRNHLGVMTATPISFN